MRLLKKKTVFLQSADAGSGTTGNFSIDLPSDNTFEEDHLFKIYISRVHLRNSFFYVKYSNSQFFWCVVPTTTVAPNPPASVTNPGAWTPANLPLGCLVDYDVVKFMNTLLVNPPGTASYNSLQCTLRNGRMYWNYQLPSSSAQSKFYVYLYFAAGTATDRYGNTVTTGPANQALGFPAANTVYKIQPDTGGLPNQNADASARLNSNDGCPYNPSEVAMSPQLIDCNPLTDILIMTNLPTENFCYSGNSLTNNGVTVLLPVDQPPLALLVYKDQTGGNAIYQRGRSVASSLSVQLMDKLFNPIEPKDDWSFVVTMEEYEDSDKLLLDNAKQQVQDDEQMIQIMKMTLLQRELKKKTKK